MSAKESILHRIDEALAMGRKNFHLPPEAEPEPIAINKELVRQVSPATPAELTAAFAHNIELLGDTALLCEDVSEGLDWLGTDIEKRGLKSGTIDPDALHYVGRLDDTLTQFLKQPANQDEIIKAQFSVTLASFAVAEMGMIALASSPQSYRMNSLAPSVHYCLLKQSAILPDLVDAFDRHQAMNDPAGIVWITGSSRTADIDGILIHGAHGPKELTILIIKD